MTKDSNHLLNELPIWKLKQIAQEHRIDVSSCRYKRDYVERVAAKNLTEGQIRSALSKAQGAQGPAQGRDAAEEVREIGEDIQSIADRPAEPKAIPPEDNRMLDRHLDEALTMKPSFFEVDSANEDAMNRMILGDYHDAIQANRQARVKCLDQFSSFQVYSAAVSIRASEELLGKLPKDRIEVASGLKTSLAAAKMAFVHGTPRQREETIENLESLATKAYEAYWGQSDRAEKELLELLADYESFGTRTEEARRYLDIAASARRGQNLEEHARMLSEAHAAAKRARAARASEIEGAYHMVRAAATEAKESGADIGDAENGLAEARKAMETGSFAHATKLMAEIERAADTAHVERLKADKDLERTKTEFVRSTEVRYGPVIKEAASYGLEVQEPMLYAGNMKAALDRSDLVNAAKFARRVKEIMDDMEGTIDKKRIETGVAVKERDSKCGKCGKKSLYTFPDSLRKCTACGHSFTIPLEERATDAASEPPVETVRSETPQDAPHKDDEAKAPEKKRWFKW